MITKEQDTIGKPKKIELIKKSIVQNLTNKWNAVIVL